MYQRERLEKKVLAFPGSNIFRLKIRTVPNLIAGHFTRLSNSVDMHHLADSESVRQYGARLLRREGADLSLAKGWLSTCEKLHGKRCSDPPWLVTGRAPFFRVIDVKQRRVVRAPVGCRYIALSYAWGGPQTVMALKDSFILDSHGEMYMDLPIKLPRTIEDAISVVLTLNETHLWVDSLCIIQGDAKEKDQIDSMDSIYGSAVLTIAATGGASADTGLMGVVPGSRNTKQVVEKVKNLSLTLTLPPFVDVVDEQSTWNTRAWTYQERMLSKRSLMFTQQQMYFLCSCDVWSEEVICEPDSSMEMSMFRKTEEGKAPQRSYSLDTAAYNIHNDDPTEESMLNTYMKIVGEYSLRKISFASDALNAITGVLNVIGNLGLGRFYWGLPEAYFDHALLWYLSDGGYRESDRLGFPSWSWAGWQQRLHVTWDLADWDEMHVLPALSWYIVTGSSEPTAIVTSRRRSINPADSAVRSHPNGVSSQSISDTPAWRYNIHPEHSALQSHTCGVSLQSISNAPAIPSSLRSSESGAKTYLYFWTSSANFRLGDVLTWTPAALFVEEPAEPLVSHFQILDLAGKWVGSLVMSRTERDRRGSDPQDFIFLSYAWEFDMGVRETVQISRERDWQVVNVMLIEWDGPVSERVAVGKIHVDAWNQADLRGRWVILG